MFAYSSLENMGLVAIGLGVGGIGYYAVFLHLIFHSFTKASMFYQIQQVHHIYKSYLIKNTGNYFKYYLPGAVVILLSFISITGIPPSGMFFSEFMMFRALFEHQYYILLIIVLILLSFTIWALGRNFFRLVFSTPEDLDESRLDQGDPVQSISQYVLLGLVIYLGFNPPSQMVALINEAIKNLPF